MKVIDLRCAHDHRFEGWFGSDADWQSQRERKLVACPLCGDVEVERVPSAPRLNLSHAAAPAEKTVEVAKPAASDMQATWLRALREVVERTEDVGERFPEEARRIHYGEVEHRGIRGRASREETAALREEGIEVMPLPLPAALKGTVQ